MKKIYSFTAILLAVFAGNVSGQSQRTILAEEFTQASCGPCAAQNPTFNALLQTNSTKVIGLKYQTSWPGVDPMNAQTQTWVGPRVTYYGVTGVPYATMDGTPQTGASYSGAPANWTQAGVNTRWAVTSPFTVTASHSFDATYSNINVVVDLACTQAVTGTLALQVALVEKEIDFCSAPGANGETAFFGVMRKMLPDANGTVLATAWTSGQTQQLNLTSAIPAYIYDLKQLAVVVFVQDNATKQVLQAAISEPLPIAQDASLKNCNAITSYVTCANTYDPTVTITNDGTAAISNVSLSYSVTGGATQTYNSTATIAPGASTTVNLPSLTISGSPSTFTCNVASIGGNTDYVTGNNTTSVTIYQIPSTATVAPIAQDFVATAFPPSTWNRSNGGGTATWTRSTVGASGTNGSAKMDFYNSGSGEEDILYTPKVNLTSLTNPTMTFKLAKQSYTGYTDRLDVLASTDCGANWTSVYSKSDPALTTAGAGTAAFTATAGSTTQWRLETIDLNAFAGQSEVLFAFKAISGYGNNAYVDDININSATGLVENLSLSGVSVSPSLTSGEVQVAFNGVDTKNVTISIMDASGKLLEKMSGVEMTADKAILNLAKYDNGVYMLQVESNGATSVNKVVLNK